MQILPLTATTTLIAALVVPSAASGPLVDRSELVSSARITSEPIKLLASKVAAVGSAGNGAPQAQMTGASMAPVSPVVAFAWPLFPRPAVFRPFDRPRDQWSPGHRGVDLLAAVGQQVLSAGAGVVAFSGAVAGGGVLTVRHPGGLRTTYEPVDGRLPSGTLVHRGTRVGVLSPTPGHCAPRGCLHWGAISGEAYLDPLSLLGFGRPILLPLG